MEATYLVCMSDYASVCFSDVSLRGRAREDGNSGKQDEMNM